MSFFLFILVTGALFIRPAEFVPSLAGTRFYEALILACLVATVPRLLGQFSGRSMADRPVVVCCVGLLAAVILSNLAQLDPGSAWSGGQEFAKVLLYYFLLVSVVDTPGRLRTFLMWLVAFSLTITAVALLEWHHYIDLPSFKPLLEWDYDGATGQEIWNPRLRGGNTSVFDDPNDICLILVVALLISLYFAGDARVGMFRPIWLVPTGLFAYAIRLTSSRGGLLTLLAGLITLLYGRYGKRRGALLAGVVLPVALVLFGGRQADISTSGGTGQTRIQLWAEGLAIFLGSPLFGVGYGHFRDYVSHVAHNSFVHCYTELGFFGGTLFIGAFYSALEGLRRMWPAGDPIADPELGRLRSYIIAVVVGYAMGMMTLSRSYIIPTYLVLGLATVLPQMGGADASASGCRFDTRHLARMIGLSAAFVAVIRTFVLMNVRWQ